MGTSATFGSGSGLWLANPTPEGRPRDKPATLSWHPCGRTAASQRAARHSRIPRRRSLSSIAAVGAGVAPLHEQAFRLERPAETVAAISVSCERCDWAVRGRGGRGARPLPLDGAYSQHLILARGTRAEYRVLLGAVREGEHRLSLSLDAHWSARGTGRCESRASASRRRPQTIPATRRSRTRRSSTTRKGSLRRFSDAPLIAWVEAFPAADGGRELRYSIVFSHEDGGTPLDRLMATWGRATDIELVYAVELDASGRVRRAEFQGKDHVTTPFAGRREGSHPVLYVVTKNNMVSDHGPSTPRVALVPAAFSLDGVSREAVMDAETWTYQVSAVEVRREGLGRGRGPGRARADPGPAPIRLRGLCPGERRSARVRLSLLLGADGGLQWYASDAGRRGFRRKSAPCAGSPRAGCLPCPGARSRCRSR